MTDARKLWGLHNDEYNQELISGGYVSIGWPEMGDLRRIGNDQLAMREAVAVRFPGKKPGAYANWAGTLRRFAFETVIGDLVVFPNKQDRTLAFGTITGPYVYNQQDVHQPHRRSVDWLKTGVARSMFSQPALFEIGSALTMFAVRNHRDEFLAFVDAPDEEKFTQHQSHVIASPLDDADAGTVAEMPSAERIDEHTRDFISNALLTELTHEEFEHFTADLLRCMGYQARVTGYGSDGGVDVIAHKDALGVEPPIIKVQCKHTSATQGGPEVQRLIGTLDRDEAGLFFTLGSYSSDAIRIERQRQNLRLFSGPEVTELAIKHYDSLHSRWRSKMPLRRVWAVEQD
ncbi:restriction endonuclease [Corynebacterium sanguinis]